MSIPTLNPLIARIGVPDAISTLPAWLCWRFESVPGETKQRKVPLYVDGSKRRGRQGSAEDRARLVTYLEAVKAAMARGWGVGFCPMPEWHICALDFDNCVNAGQVHPDVLALVAGTYAELSPSGRGVRAFVRGDLGNSKDAHGIPFGLETFSSKGYVTVTGSRLAITDLTDSANTVAETSDEVRAYCAARFKREAPSEPAVPSDTPPLGLTAQQLQDALDVLDPSCAHEPWLRVGMALHHETAGRGFGLWDDWSADGAQYPGTDALQSRWDSFGRGGQNPVTAQALVRMANENGARIDIAVLEAADDFDVMPDTPAGVAAAQGKAERFKVISAEEFTGRPPPEWLIKHILPKAELVVLFGESGSGKSFMALDLAGALDRGVEWRGHRTRKARVVYIAAEGAGGFRNRMAAYCQFNKIEPGSLGIGVIHAAPNMLLKDDALDVCKSIKAWGGADVVIVDTFAQVTPGANENAAEDMGKALGHCKGIHRALGSCVVLVHHAGKDASKGARGWSGLKAAADAELEVTKGIGGRMLRTSKQKDGEDDLKFGFELEQIPIGMDADGEVITSCVVRECELPAVQQVGAAGKKLSKWEKHVVAAVSEMATVQAVGLEKKAIAEAAAMLEPKPENARDMRSRNAMRALESLLKAEDSPYFDDGDCISIG